VCGRLVVFTTRGIRSNTKERTSEHFILCGGVIPRPWVARITSSFYVPQVPAEHDWVERFCGKLSLVRPGASGWQELLFAGLSAEDRAEMVARMVSQGRRCCQSGLHGSPDSRRHVGDCVSQMLDRLGSAVEDKRREEAAEADEEDDVVGAGGGVSTAGAARTTTTTTAHTTTNRVEVILNG